MFRDCFQTLQVCLDKIYAGYIISDTGIEQSQKNKLPFHLGQVLHHLECQMLNRSL